MTEGPERSAAGPRSARDSGALADVDLSTHDWRALIEQLPLAVYIDRLDWWSSNIYTSRQIEAILGYTTEEWTAEDHLLLKVLHPDDRERVMAAHRRSCETGEPFRMEYRMISRDGRVVWFLDQATVVPGQPGRPGFHHGFLLDITERKQLEEALAASTEELGRQKRYFESLLEISPVAIVTTDLEDVVTSWNPAAERLFGYSAREAVGRKIDDLVARTAVLRAEAAAVTRDALHKGRVQAITRRTHKDGSLIDVELLASPVLLHGEPVGTYAIYHDVRELKRAEERYRALVEGLPLVTYVDEPNERAASIYVSPQIEALLGYTPDEWVADPELFVRRVHPDDRERVLAEHARAFAAGEPSWSFDYRLLARDGRTVWLHDEALIVRDEHGTPLYVQGFQVDVSERKAAEEALRRSEAEVRRQKQYFESLVEISPTAVLTLDLEERVTSWNPAAERLFGYSKAEAVGQRVMDLTLRPEDRGERDALMQQVAATGSARMTTRRRRKDGSLVDVEVLVVALEADGERFGSYVIYHDISELLRRRQYLESLLELSPTAIVTMDLEGNVTSWNPAAESLFGYTQQEAIGRCVDDLVARSDEVRAEAVDAGRQAAKGEKVHLTTRRTRKDGTLVDVDVRAAPIVVGDEQVGMYSLYHDVSELLRARREAEAATAAKSAFLATMSHEIRTPLNAVIGMTELLLDTELTTAQLDLAHVVHRSGDALLDVINDILDFSKIEAGRLELEHRPLVLRDCVESALEMVGAAAAGKGLDVACLIDPEAPSAILGDSTRLRHILVNLLTNAVKFTERGEVVLTVEWRASAAEDESAHRHHLHFTVRDTGIGIPADRIDGLFESFSQVDASTTRRYGGTGLGLAISKRLCELMRGEMWVESEPGKGSAFHFTVAAEATSGPSLPPVAAELRGMRLLVVDDNAANREVVTRQARSWGMVPRETGSPTEALEWIRRGDPLDVAILDMQMPEMDGLTLAHEIRRYRDADALPLVMLTSLGRRADDREARGEFTAILTKPIKASQLYEVVTAAVGAQARRARRAREAEPDVIPGRRAQLRVLLAEDNAVNQQLALRMLGMLGYQADVAVNGLEALQALRRRPYDLVLMDVEMPEMDGLEAARRIHREWPGDERPRIVAMTANAMQGDREICLAAGMDDYLSKPIHLDELANALRRCAPRGATPPQTAQPVSPPDSEDGVLDLEALEQLHARAGDRDFVIELVDTFLREGPALVETLRGALQDADAQQLRRAAHTLKSNARVFGARALAALCQEVEAMARVGVLAGAAELAARIDDEYARVADALQAAGRELA
jgi:PAS domain S-box-containing protein